jgi:hypothetical protein
MSSIRKALFLVAVGAVLYAAAYGAVRWRKFIVMREYVRKEEMMLVRHTGPGLDVRNNWKGQLKNRMNPVVFLAFRPIGLVEDCFRGFSKPIFSPSHAEGSVG